MSSFDSMQVPLLSQISLQCMVIGGTTPQHFAQLFDYRNQHTDIQMVLSLICDVVQGRTQWCPFLMGLKITTR